MPVIHDVCGFTTREGLDSTSFAVEVVDAANVNSEPIDPPPTVEVGSVTRR